MRRNDITKTILNKLYNNKLLSKKEIALRLRCNITTINKKMNKFGIIPRKQKEAVRIAMLKKIIKLPKEKLEKLYLKNKLSIKKIAEKLHYSQDIVARELKINGIPIKTSLESARLRSSKIKKQY